MTDSEIKEMLKDIIDNGAEYEFRWLRTDGWSDWKPYRLGEEILYNDSRYEYRKIEKWYVYLQSDGSYIFLRELGKKTIFDKIMFEGTKEECEKWIKEHTKSWLEIVIAQKIDEESVHFISAYKLGVKDICQKILEEVKIKNIYLSIESKINYFALEDIIKDLGVNL